MKNLGILPNDEAGQDLKIVVCAADSIPSDQLPFLINLVNAAYQRHDWLFPLRRTNLLSFREEVTEADLVLLGNSKSDEILGMGIIQPKQDALFLKMVAVNPNQQGKGYGTRLLQAVEKIAAIRGFSRVELITVAEIGNVYYYLKQGFGKLSESTLAKGTWGAKESFTIVTMEKRLSTT